MKKLQARLKNKKGFTLVELLVVVAIIAILVAISIPMVTGALNSAKKATDDANVRAAEGAAMVAYLTSDTGFEDIDGDGVVYYYDAESGKIYKDDEKGDTFANSYQGYNQQAEPNGEDGGVTSAKSAVVKVTIKSPGMESTWVTVASLNPGS